jgi:hypothetical protein
LAVKVFPLEGTPEIIGLGFRTMYFTVWVTNTGALVISTGLNPVLDPITLTQMLVPTSANLTTYLKSVAPLIGPP